MNLHRFLLPLLLTASLAHAKPNIILIVTDDQGYADAGFRDPAVHTPSIDKLVAGGVELRRFYACPVCSPTRAGLMSGQFPIRFGMQRAVNRPHSEVGLPEEMTTLPEALGAAGYPQRHIVGKWHLGNMKKRQLPMNHGFTSQYGAYCSGIGYFNLSRFGVHDFHRNQQTVKEEGYYTDLLSDEAVRIIDGQEGKDPFFLYLPYGAPHTPLQAPQKEIERYKHLGKQRATFLAMVTVIDQGIGRILDSLDRKGIADNTLIVFMSDNGGGPGSNNKPLNGKKSSLLEGGVRVIAAARWPGRIPAGTVCETPCSYIDILPTFLDAAGAPIPDGVKPDGRSALPQWEGKAGRDGFELFSFFEKRGKYGEDLFVIEGDWKLIRKGSPILKGARAEGTTLTLFDLKSDLGETTDLAAQHPERVERMLEKLIAFRKLRPEGGVPPMVDPKPKGWKPPANWEPID
jgi:arylsulfatase A-like enzyme